MSTNKFLKILSSLPVIFISLYFIPFLGVCLVILRQFIYNNKSKYSTSISIIILGVLILIPMVLNSILDLVNVSINGFSLKEIIETNIYVDLVDYSKFLLCLGVILLIISLIFKSLIEKVQAYIYRYMHSSISNRMEMEREIAKENDMEIKLKQERAKNTHVVFCSYCGADNMLTEKIGQCKYCRRQIEYKE